MKTLFVGIVDLLIAGFFIAVIFFFVSHAPLWLIGVVWALGAIIVHLRIYRGCVGGPYPWWDFNHYAQDTGIPLIVFLWWAFYPMFFWRMDIEYRLCKALGIPKRKISS